MSKKRMQFTMKEILKACENTQGARVKKGKTHVTVFPPNGVEPETLSLTPRRGDTRLQVSRLRKKGIDI